MARGHVDADDYTWHDAYARPAPVQAFGSVETYPERNDRRVAELERVNADLLARVLHLERMVHKLLNGGGDNVTRGEALRIALQILEQAERQRGEVAEAEARGGCE